MRTSVISECKWQLSLHKTYLIEISNLTIIKLSAALHGLIGRIRSPTHEITTPVDCGIIIPFKSINIGWISR